MNKCNRIFLFIICIILLIIVYAVTSNKLDPLGNISVVLFSSLIMLSFVSLFLEHFFTKPTDVLASTIAILLLLSPLKSDLSKLGIWYNLFFFYNIMLFLTSILALLLLDDNKSTSSVQNKISSHLKRFSTFFGNGRFLFFSLFILTLLYYVNNQSKEFLILFGYSTVILLIEPKKYLQGIINKEKSHCFDIGEIFGVQSKNIFLAKLYKQRCPVHRYDVVEFRYSMNEDHKILKGLIIDNYLLNQEQWIKILATKHIREALEGIKSRSTPEVNVVYKLDKSEDPDLLKRFVGFVIDKSDIEKIKFEYAYKVPINEGDLLELYIENLTVLYQVVQGIIETEMLESKNEAGFIVGEAVQLGLWDQRKKSFQKYGWVPDINTPVFLAKNIEPPELNKEEIQIGTIPNTNYPVTMNLTDAVTHHLGILGVTGSGKSVFSRNLIREILKEGNKVICIDFTGEYRPKLSNLGIDSIVLEEDQEKMFKAIDDLSEELAKFANQQSQEKIKSLKKILTDSFYTSIKNFLESEQKNVALFELPDVSNTTGILDYTKWFFKTLFYIAKKDHNFGKRVCIVLEEAHTVIPEWNFIGVSEKQAQSLVNNIGQIALQGRKYGVGFIVIAQRTANVSKTVLTQCNSIVAFQQFDKTSSDFLSNYLGQDMVNVLPNLKFRQAIVVGKAFKAGIPVILEVPNMPDKNEQDPCPLSLAEIKVHE